MVLLSIVQDIYAANGHRLNQLAFILSDVTHQSLPLLWAASVGGILKGFVTLQLYETSSFSASL